MQQRRFARAARANDGDCLAARDADFDAIQHLQLTAIFLDVDFLQPLRDEYWLRQVAGPPRRRVAVSPCRPIAKSPGRFITHDGSLPRATALMRAARDKSSLRTQSGRSRTQSTRRPAAPVRRAVCR